MAKQQPKQPISYPQVRLGAIGFINTLPIYAGYQPPSGVALHYAPPARLNAMMGAGLLDVSPVSSAYYLRHKQDLVLLEDLSVSSHGAVESVLFISKTPMDATLQDQPVIAVPDDSETSIALLADLILKRTGRDLRPWFMTYPAGRYQEVLERVGCALVIGDNALAFYDAGVPKGYYCYDLATMWAEETQLPFVFAVWVANKTWAQAYPESLKQVNQQLVESKQRFFASPQPLQAAIALAQDRLPASGKISSERIASYFTRSLNYDLGVQHQQALALFDEVIATLEMLPVSERSVAHAGSTMPPKPDGLLFAS